MNYKLLLIANFEFLDTKNKQENLAFFAKSKNLHSKFESCRILKMDVSLEHDTLIILHVEYYSVCPLVRIGIQHFR
jgi:hypothetical protein